MRVKMFRVKMIRGNALSQKYYKPLDRHHHWHIIAPGAARSNRNSEKVSPRANHSVQFNEQPGANRMKLGVTTNSKSNAFQF